MRASANREDYQTSRVDGCDCRLDGTPGVGWELFVDDISIGSGSFGYSVENRVVFGDFINAASAQAEITGLTFTQVPEPSAHVLAVVSLVGLGMIRRHRHTLAS